jgi:TrmH family RNA methyltransferase
MQIITSRQNILIKHIVTLHDTDHRVEHGQCIAQGLRTCQTLAASGIRFIHIFYTEEHKDTAYTLPADDYICVALDVMQKISTTITPSGILAVFAVPTRPDVSTLRSGLVLASITNPGNMGTLIRTAVALGVPSLVIVEGCDPWNPKVVQASAGTIGSIPIFELSWDALMDAKKNIPLCALVVEGGSSPQEVAIKESLLIVGNEAHGIPKEWLKACTTKITLDMPGGTESLNAAIAGSIALYVGYVGMK